MIIHAGFAWAADDEALMDGVRVWRATVPDEFYDDDWHDPAKMQEHAAQQVSDDDLRESFVISTRSRCARPEGPRARSARRHRRRLQNMSGADPMGTIRLYKDEVLPVLRGARV